MAAIYTKKHGVAVIDLGEISGPTVIDLVSNSLIQGFHCDEMAAEDSITLSACEDDGTEIVKVASITMPAAATISHPTFVKMGTVWTRYLLVTVGGTPTGALYIYVGSE